MNALGRQHGDDQEPVGRQGHGEGAPPFAAADEDVYILEEHHQEQGQVAGAGDIQATHFVEVVEDAEGDRADVGARDQNLLYHVPVEDGLIRISRWVAEQIRFTAFEGQGHILNAVGHQVEPQELHR